MIEKFKALSLQNKKIILGTIVFLATVFLGWKFLLEPDLKSIDVAKKISSENVRKGTVLQEIAAMEKKLKTFEPLLSGAQQSDWLIEAVNRMAAESGLTLLSASPQPPSKDADFTRIALTIEASGGYHNLGRFIEKIENYRPLIKVSNLRILRSERRDPGNLKITLSVNSYYLPKGGAQ